jgi:predicted secreted protein
MQVTGIERKAHSKSGLVFSGLVFLGLPSAFVVLLVCCPVAASAATKIVTDADKGLAVQLKSGDVLEVRLSSNPTTGYDWYVHPQSTKLPKLTGQSQTDAAPGEGRPIVQIFKFEPKGKGTGTLLLHYVRSWEKPDPNEEQFSLQVTIE